MIDIITSKFFTRDELAKKLRVSRQFLDALGDKGPPFFRIGRAIRYDACAVSAWIIDQATRVRPAL